MNKFEKQHKLIINEYEQIDESLGKSIKNFFKHPTRKGQGEELIDTWTKFIDMYHFKESEKTQGLFVKNIEGFKVGLLLSFKDGEETSFGTVKVTVINKKNKKYLVKDGEVKVKHSYTLEEFAEKIQEFLKKQNNKIILSSTDMSVDDEDDEQEQSKKSKSTKKGSNNTAQIIKDMYLKNGVAEEDIQKYLYIFKDLYENLNNDQKIVISKLIM